MKIGESQMNHVLRPGVMELEKLFVKNGFELRIAGGAVRDLILGIIPTDLDFATTATPTEMKNIFDKEQVRMVNAGGEKHGTITARILEENFECTTLRIDRVTDGRHAEVEFIRDWKLDAGRRDLTVNALFLGLDGTVYDYFNGIKHINDRFITFVGEPEKRIQEDYLRILRYFRFYGRLAKSENNHDSKVIDAIKNNCSGLSKISGERIWVELKKIVCGRFGCELMIKMLEWGIGPLIGFPSQFNQQQYKHINKKLVSSDISSSNLSPCTLLAAGFDTVEEANGFITRVKCSNKEKENLLSIIKYRNQIMNIDSLKPIQDLLIDLIHKEKRSKDLAIFVATELLKYCGRKDLLDNINDENIIPIFPIKGGLLVDKVSKRNRINSEMRRLLEEWKQSNFTLTREELLDRVQS